MALFECDVLILASCSNFEEPIELRVLICFEHLENWEPNTNVQYESFTFNPILQEIFLVALSTWYYAKKVLCGGILCDLSLPLRLNFKGDILLENQQYYMHQNVEYSSDSIVSLWNYSGDLAGLRMIDIYVMFRWKEIKGKWRGVKWSNGGILSFIWKHINRPSPSLSFSF